MIALELVLYGVRHFLDIKKLTFRPGLNLIHGGNGAGKTTITDTFFEMLGNFSFGREDAFDLAPWRRILLSLRSPNGFADVAG